MPEDDATELHQASSPAGRPTEALRVIKANKELLAASGSLLTAIFGAIVWAFAYFGLNQKPRIAQYHATCQSGSVRLRHNAAK